MDYEIVIGLEIHVQLQTESKMFSWSGTDFGLPPNTQTDPVSLGLPGTLPTMNRKAFELELKTAVALGAEIAPFTKWNRKNYLLAAPFAEEMLLRTARVFDRATDWHTRRPGSTS